MNLYSYFKPTNGLPDPRGSLSSNITPEAISLANKEHTLKEFAVSKNKGAYTEYSLELRAELEGTQSSMVRQQQHVITLEN